MIKTIKKGITAVLAAVICIGILPSGWSVKAASGDTNSVCTISLPRADDSNKNANWGHSELQYLNGWSAHSTDHFTLFAMGDYDGQICYCIEPGTSLSAGSTLTEKGEDYWDNYPDSYNSTIDADEIKVLIGRILQYGYIGAVSTTWYSQDEDGANNIANAYATQILIWEVIVGERDANFNHISTAGYNQVLDIVGADHPLRSKILSYYNSIVSSVQSHTTLPSFMSQTASDANVVELTWDGSGYSATLTDTNNVLENYSFSGNGLSFSVSGNELTISTTTAPTTAVQITATKNASRKGLVVWGDGVYDPSNNGLQDLVTYTADISDSVTGYLQAKASYGSAKIVKTSEDGKVSGVSFTISGNGVNETVTTDENGEILIENLSPGEYTITELTEDKYETQSSQTVTVIGGQTSTVIFNNTLKRGGLKVTKTAEDGLTEGIIFHLYGTSLSGSTVDEYAVTNANGVATFEDVLIGSGYTLEEVNTPNKYVVPDSQTVNIAWNAVTNATVENILKKFTVTVTKTDSETGSAQGDASLAGAVYGLYQSGVLVDTYTTDASGQFTTTAYSCGDDWTIQEMTPSEGYLLDDTVYTVGAEAKNYTVEYNPLSVGVTEEVIKGSISMIKHTDNGETQIETPEEGAVFEIYLKSVGSYDAANESERDILTCDEYGYAESKELPYGVYTVHQVSGWDGSDLMSDFDVYISSDGEIYRYLINNSAFESYVKIVKTDAETGSTIPYAGAGFQIYDPNGNLVTMTYTYPTVTTIDTFYTDSNGCLITPESLPYGTGYSIVEVQAPYGYVLDETPVYFDITEENSTEESGVTVVTVTKTNSPQMGTITVTKTGEVFYSVTETGGVYQPVYEVQSLSGAVYEIRAAEDVYTPDGTLRYSVGELIDTVTTGSDGTATSCELYLGTYIVTEISAPYGMVLSDEAHTVELTYAGQDIFVTETATSFYNERQKVEISLSKVMETDSIFGIGTNGEILSVQFGLYTAEELISVSGASIPAGSLLEIISCDENGNATFTTDLPIGCYYIKEIATDEHYILSDEKYYVVFDYVGQDTAVVEIAVNSGECIENKLIYGSVSGMKTDENGDGLAGAVIGLFQTEETEFTAETALMVTTSAEDGSFSFEGVPYGSWIIREIEQPTGYVLNDTSYEVIITKEGQAVKVTIENRQICGNITLTKVDAEYPELHLSGATFEVYADTNDNSEYDEEDELVGTLTERENGVYEMTDLTYGRYFVKETAAPDGYYVDDGVYEIFINEDGETYVVENEEGIGFTNVVMRGNLKIVKTSSDGTVEGFSFRVIGDNGYDMIFVTDENGEILIENLRIGTYTVSEISNAASAQYVLPADKTATVLENSTTIVEMYNLYQTTTSPKTGDNSHTALWLGFAGTSIIGMFACGIAGLRKKKKGGEQ